MTKQTITAKVTPNAKENSIKQEMDLFGNTIYKIKNILNLILYYIIIISIIITTYALLQQKTQSNNHFG